MLLVSLLCVSYRGPTMWARDGPERVTPTTYWRLHGRAQPANIQTETRVTLNYTNKWFLKVCPLYLWPLSHRAGHRTESDMSLYSEWQMKPERAESCTLRTQRSSSDRKPCCQSIRFGLSARQRLSRLRRGTRALCGCVTVDVNTFQQMSVKSCLTSVNCIFPKLGFHFLRKHECQTRGKVKCCDERWDKGTVLSWSVELDSCL